MAKRRRGASRTVTVDFSNVEEGGGRFRIPEGSYEMEVSEVVPHESDDNEGLKWTFTGTEGKAKGKKFFLYTMFTESSLWKLRDLLTALGQEVPKDEMDIDLDEMVGLSLTGVVQDDTYQGKISSKLVDFESGDEEEEPEARGARADKNAKSKPNGKAKLLSADEVAEMDEDELEDVIKKNKLDVDLSEFKTARRKSSAVVAALEEAELLAS